MNPSRHPADLLIRDLIRTNRRVTHDEIERVAARVANAPFDRRMLPVPIRLRGLSYQGRTLASREDSLHYHLIKRVIEERQWPHGTTAEQYVEDLRRAVRHPAARLAVYERRGGFIAATITPTSSALPASRLAAESLPGLLVVYSADRGMIVSGYQFSALDQTGIPEDSRWLV